MSPSSSSCSSLRRRLCVAGALSVPLGALNLPAWAHQGHSASRAAPAAALPPEQKPWGIAGDPRRVSRTVQIRMTDDMRFSPARIAVREGETLRLRAVNRGRMLHEIVLGTVAEIEAHAELMKKYPGMEHEEPWMAHVAAGRRADLVWHFNRPGRVDFACLVDDHYELGMAGRIDVQPRAL